MPKFVIERENLGGGRTGPPQVYEITPPRGVPPEPATEVQWLEAYVTDVALFSIYLAPDIDALRRFARIEKPRVPPVAWSRRRLPAPRLERSE